MRHSNAALPKATGPRPDTSPRAGGSSGQPRSGEGTQGMDAESDTEASAGGTDGPAPPPAPNDSPPVQDLVKGLVRLPEGIGVADHPFIYLGWFSIVGIDGIAPASNKGWPILADEGHGGRDWPCLFMMGGYAELERCRWIDHGEFLLLSTFNVLPCSNFYITL